MVKRRKLTEEELSIVNSKPMSSPLKRRKLTEEEVKLVSKDIKKPNLSYLSPTAQDIYDVREQIKPKALEAGIKGAGSGLTFGLTEQLQDKDRTKKLKEEEPFAYELGSLGGSLLNPSSGIAGKLLSKLPILRQTKQAAEGADKLSKRTRLGNFTKEQIARTGGSALESGTESKATGGEFLEGAKYGAATQGSLGAVAGTLNAAGKGAKKIYEKSKEYSPAILSSYLNKPESVIRKYMSDYRKSPEKFDKVTAPHETAKDFAADEQKLLNQLGLDKKQANEVLQGNNINDVDIHNKFLKAKSELDKISPANRTQEQKQHFKELENLIDKYKPKYEELPSEIDTTKLIKSGKEKLGKQSYASSLSAIDELKGQKIDADDIISYLGQFEKGLSDREKTPLIKNQIKRIKENSNFDVINGKRTIPSEDLKDILQNISQSYVDQTTGALKKPSETTISKLYSGLNSFLKGNENYAEKMLKTSAETRTLTDIPKNFGKTTKQQVKNLLKALKQKDGTSGREEAERVLGEIDSHVGTDLLDKLDPKKVKMIKSETQATELLNELDGLEPGSEPFKLIRSMLEEANPKVKEVFEKQDKNSELHGKVKKLFNKEGDITKIERSLGQAHKGSVDWNDTTKVLEEMDNALKTDWKGRFEATLMKRAFDDAYSTTNGSMNVQKFSNALKSIGAGAGAVAGTILGGPLGVAGAGTLGAAGGVLGASLGAYADKYGPSSTKKSLDFMGNISDKLKLGRQSEAAQMLSRLNREANNGDVQAIATRDIVNHIFLHKDSTDETRRQTR